MISSQILDGEYLKVTTKRTLSRTTWTNCTTNRKKRLGLLNKEISRIFESSWSKTMYLIIWNGKISKINSGNTTAIRSSTNWIGSTLSQSTSLKSRSSTQSMRQGKKRWSKEKIDKILEPCWDKNYSMDLLVTKPSGDPSLRSSETNGMTKEC